MSIHHDSLSHHPLFYWSCAGWKRWVWHADVAARGCLIACLAIDSSVFGDNRCQRVRGRCKWKRRICDLLSLPPVWRVMPVSKCSFDSICLFDSIQFTSFTDKKRLDLWRMLSSNMFRDIGYLIRVTLYHSEPCMWIIVFSYSQRTICPKATTDFFGNCMLYAYRYNWAFKVSLFCNFVYNIKFCFAQFLENHFLFNSVGVCQNFCRSNINLLLLPCSFFHTTGAKVYR